MYMLICFALVCCAVICSCKEAGTDTAGPDEEGGSRASLPPVQAGHSTTGLWIVSAIYIRVKSNFYDFQIDKSNDLSGNSCSPLNCEILGLQLLRIERLYGVGHAFEHLLFSFPYSQTHTPYSTCARCAKHTVSQVDSL